MIADLAPIYVFVLEVIMLFAWDDALKRKSKTRGMR